MIKFLKQISGLKKQIEHVHLPPKMNRNTLLIIGFILFFSACQQSQKNSKDVEAVMKDSTKYTTIQWQDSAINFGTKKMGDVVNIIFHCTNIGNKPLYLSEVRPGCGCTLVDYTKTPIEPGNQGIIQAKFDTKKSHTGSVHKTVYVSSNSKNVSTPYLSFSGVITEADSSKKIN